MPEGILAGRKPVQIVVGVVRGVVKCVGESDEVAVSVVRERRNVA